MNKKQKIKETLEEIKKRYDRLNVCLDDGRDVYEPILNQGFCVSMRELNAILDRLYYDIVLADYSAFGELWHSCWDSVTDTHLPENLDRVIHAFITGATRKLHKIIDADAPGISKS